MVARRQVQEKLRNYFKNKSFPYGELARIFKEAGVSKSAFIAIRLGHKIPSFKTAFKISEVADLPGLLSIIREYRTKTCENPLCGESFVDETPSNCRHYHDPKCANRMAQIHRKGIHLTPQRVVVAERRLLMYSKAVAAMCKDCEPEGVCRSIGCPLRSVSPLPYFEKVPMKVVRRA